MNNKDLIKAYKDLKNSEAPDLWTRIDKATDTASLADEVNGDTQEQPATTVGPNKILPFKKINKIIFSSAAVILVVLVATAVIGLPLFNKSFSVSEDSFLQDINKQKDFELSQNTADKYEPSADAIVMPTTTVAPTYSTTEAPTTVYIEDSKDAPSEAFSSEETRGETTDKVISAMPKTYAELELADLQPVKLPIVTAPQSPQTEYFTMEAFADTDLLIQATVQGINFIYNDKKEAHSVVYTVVADNVYYSDKEYPIIGHDSNGADILTVISPIVQADDVWMYPLQVNRTYLLPLTLTDSGAIKIVFPYAPQIELSLDGFCVFHSGWQALIDDSTGSLLVDCIHPDDYFYDRMMIRHNNGFVKDLIHIIKSLKN